MSEQLSQLDINPRITHALIKANIKKFETVLSLSNPDIQRSTGLSSGDVSLLKKAVARAVPKLPCVSALDILEEKCPSQLTLKKLTTGCKSIDEALRGGFLSHGITEISGESSAGKTQLCLQLCLNVQLPFTLGGLSGGAAYICTEDVFPNKRLHQMIQYFNLKVNSLSNKIQYGDNIFIEHISDISGLKYCIQKRLPILLSKGDIKLVVVDSVASLFRCEYDQKDMVQRSKDLASMGACLHQLSNQYNIPVVCVNQVTDSMDVKDRHRKHIPSLGLTWSNQVTTRITLTRTNQHVTIPKHFINNLVIGGFETCVRDLEVIFAPHLPMLKLPCIIDQEGFKGWTC
ncbi:XRCC3 [Mytilus edulis]|uniref:XRCC3 n=1 Tax=Mytilus edulis TaxID=6550 RepID=A0A8S3TYS3_MYTED|nr:XRCC3 [Mytilus edulis]